MVTDNYSLGMGIDDGAWHLEGVEEPDPAAARKLTPRNFSVVPSFSNFHTQLAP